MIETKAGEAAQRTVAALSRLRLLAGVRRLRATEVEIVTRVLRCDPVILSDQRVFIWQSPGRVAPASELAGRWGSASIAIAADGLAQIEPRLDGFESFVPTETCAALVEHALHPVISILERAAGVPLEFNELHRGRRESLLDEPVEIGFVVYERDMKPMLRGYVRAPADCWRGLEFGRLQTLRPRRQGMVPIRLGVQIGALRLRAAQLARLVPGDALRVCKQARGLALPVLLVDCQARPLLRATVHDNTLTLEEAMASANEFEGATTQEPTEPTRSGEDLLDEIECDVTFELGALRLPVSEVARLRAGQPIRLGVRLQDQPVRIMVNGRPVGRGEMAALGDEIVVVVTDTSRLPHV
jgi:type III secretion protein Q